MTMLEYIVYVFQILVLLFLIVNLGNRWFQVRLLTRFLLLLLLVNGAIITILNFLSNIYVQQRDIQTIFLLSFMFKTLAFSFFYFYIEISTSRSISLKRILPLTIFGTVFTTFLTINIFKPELFNSSNLGNIALHHSFYLHISAILLMSLIQLYLHLQRVKTIESRKAIKTVMMTTGFALFYMIAEIVNFYIPEITWIKQFVMIIILILTAFSLFRYPILLTSIPQQIGNLMITDQNGIVLYQNSFNGDRDTLVASGMSAINIFLASTIGSENSVTYLTTDDKSIDIAKHGAILGYLISDYSTYFMKISLKDIVVKISEIKELSMPKFRIDNQLLEELNIIVSDFF
ncbi:MAG: hypothetical protein INQ03_03580 [Candidatus Heimdallarchaeota archaeon]|nr:hypothetical protein [Candidatus Heimdallarchaeota archaeon]